MSTPTPSEWRRPDLSTETPTPWADDAPRPQSDITHRNPVRFLGARQSDCMEIAKLYRIASDGVADYIWTRLARAGEDPLEVGKRRYQRKEAVFSYRNCTVATVGTSLAGMLMAFPMWTDPCESESDPVLAPYSRLEEDASLYISGVALFPKYRGLGIGTRLLRLAERRARRASLEKTSLIVFEQNRGARRLYERLGYVERAREPVVPHPLIHHTGSALLMVKTLG